MERIEGKQIAAVVIAKIGLEFFGAAFDFKARVKNHPDFPVHMAPLQRNRRLGVAGAAERSQDIAGGDGMAGAGAKADVGQMAI